MPPGADPHGFEPSLADRGRLGGAALIVANGLGLETGLDDTLTSVADDGTPVLYVGDHIDHLLDMSRPFAGEQHAEGEEDGHADDDADHDHDHSEGDGHADDHTDEDEDHSDEDHSDEDEHDDEDSNHDHDDETDDDGHDHAAEDGHDHTDEEDEDHADDDHADDHAAETQGDDHDHADEDDHAGHDHGPIDPHIWLDPLLVAESLEEISEALALEAGLDQDSLTQCVNDYETALRDLHEELVEILSEVPPERRKLITNHDAFGYFASRYDFDVIGYILGTSTLAEPSAARLPELGELLDETSLPAVFDEHLSIPSDTLKNLVDGRQEVQIATLYTGSLGPPDSEAATYLGMLHSNAMTITSALSGG